MNVGPSRQLRHRLVAVSAHKARRHHAGGGLHEAGSLAVPVRIPRRIPEVPRIAHRSGLQAERAEPSERTSAQSLRTTLVAATDLNDVLSVQSDNG